LSGVVDCGTKTTLILQQQYGEDIPFWLAHATMMLLIAAVVLLDSEVNGNINILYHTIMFIYYKIMKKIHSLSLSCLTTLLFLPPKSLINWFFFPISLSPSYGSWPEVTQAKAEHAHGLGQEHNQ
jgi:hypothetical protein